MATVLEVIKLTHLAVFSGRATTTVISLNLVKAKSERVRVILFPALSII